MNLGLVEHNADFPIFHPKIWFVSAAKHIVDFPIALIDEVPLVKVIIVNILAVKIPNLPFWTPGQRKTHTFYITFSLSSVITHIWDIFFVDAGKGLLLIHLCKSPRLFFMISIDFLWSCPWVGLYRVEQYSIVLYFVLIEKKIKFIFN